MTFRFGFKMSSIKPSFFFGHYDHEGKRYSRIRVEELLSADHDIYALMALIDSEDDLEWYWLDPDSVFDRSEDNLLTVDRNRAAYVIKTMYDSLIKDGGRHMGECVNISCVCTRCMVEEMYIKTIDLIKQSNVFHTGETKDMLAVVMSYEEKYLDRKEYADQYITARSESNPVNVIRDAWKLFPMPSGEFQSRMDYWNFMDSNAQDVYRARANIFKCYFNHPEMVDDIKWT
jgi:hypothetical protein